MSTPSVGLKPDSAWHNNFAALNAANGPFADLRRQAWSEFSAKGFPDPREEEWRWTNVSPIAGLDFTDADQSAVAAVSAESVLALAPSLAEGPRLTLVDGLFHAAASNLADLPEGLKLHPLAAVLAEDPTSVSELLGQQAEGRLNRFVSMNTALMRDGVVIEVADNAQISTPVTILHAFGLTGPQRSCQPRVLIRLGAHAELTLIEQHVSMAKQQSLNNEVLEITLGENAKLNHVILGEAADDSFMIIAAWAALARDAHYRSLNYQFGGKLTRLDLNISEDDTGAHSELIGLLMPRGHQHIDTHTRIHHNSAHTTSNEHYRAIADEHGRAVFKGRILVAQDAQKIEAYQSSANLILSDNAEIDAKPELEIYADDVKCSHGATIGQLDKEALYYLQSRGISKSQARELLIFGFAEEVINHLDHPELRAHLTRRVAGNLASTLLEDFLKP